MHVMKQLIIRKYIEISWLLFMSTPFYCFGVNDLIRMLLSLLYCKNSLLVWYTQLELKHSTLLITTLDDS